MQEDNRTTLSEVGPDLSIEPHVLPLLIEMLIGDGQQAFSQQQQLHTHLATCHYCRSAVIYLLGVEKEYDHRNNDTEEHVNNLLTRFAHLHRAIETMEAHAYERMGAYAEAIAAEGRDKANLRFPDMAVHLRTCSDCRSILEATLAFITGS
jgi:hypothetical protein